MYRRYERLLEKRGISNYKVSKETGISQATLSDWKNGKSTPKYDKLQKLADYFNISIDYLIGKSASSIIEDKLEEIGMTQSELAEKACVPITFIKNMDNIVPDQEIDMGEQCYVYISSIAWVLGIPSSKLRLAFARQEVPAYEGPELSPEEAFKDSDDNDIPPHVNDPEALKYLDELHKRPEMKTLFQVSRKASKEDIETAITLIEALKKKGEQ